MCIFSTNESFLSELLSFFVNLAHVRLAAIEECLLFDPLGPNQTDIRLNLQMPRFPATLPWNPTSGPQVVGKKIFDEHPGGTDGLWVVILS